MKADEVDTHILLSDARGIYIPRDFLDFENICNEDGSPIADKWKLERAILKDPDDPDYWEAWDTILQYCYLHDGKGNIYFLHQQGDLFAISLADFEQLDDAEADKFWDNYNY